MLAGHAVSKRKQIIKNCYQNGASTCKNSFSISNQSEKTTMVIKIKRGPEYFSQQFLAQYFLSYWPYNLA